MTSLDLPTCLFPCWKPLPMNLNAFANDFKQKPAAALLAITITAIGLIILFLVLMLYVVDRETDRGVPEHPRLYRIESQFNLPNGDTVRSAQVPFPLVEALQKNAAIENVGYAYRLETRLRRGNMTPRVTVFAVTPAFMEQLRPYGDNLPAPGLHDIYITSDFNRQYLGLDDPVGKTVNLGENGQFTIKAIVEPRPNSSLQLPAIIAFTPDLVAGYQDQRLDWYDTHVYAFARLQSASSEHFIQQMLAQTVSNNAPQLPGAPFTPSSFLTFTAKNILDMHYDEGYGDEFAMTRAKSLLYMLYTAALFVLFSTVANFFNINGILNAARRPSQHIKRSLGASNTQLLVESLSALLPQFLITLVLALFFLCILTSISPRITLLLTDPPLSRTITLFSGEALFIGLVMLVSHLLSLTLLILGKQASNAPNRYTHRGVYDLNRIMMVVQLFVAGITVYLWAGVMTQYHTMKEADFGYPQTQRLTFALDEEFYSLGKVRELEHRLQETAGAVAISLSSWQPFNPSRQVISVQHAGQSVQQQFTPINTLSADAYFIDVVGLTTLAGQTNRLQASTDDGLYHAIVTRAFMSAMGQNSFDDVLNTRYYLPFPERQQELRVLRVVENFDLGAHLPHPQPLIIFINDRLERFATLSYPKETSPEALIAQIKGDGPQDLVVQTVQELHNRHFHNQKQVLNVITFTAILALVLMVISTLIISISEAQRLHHSIKIMEAVGGSVATSLFFFLQQHLLSILFASLTALAFGSLLLRRGLQQYEWVADRVYLNGFAALLLLTLLVVAMMALSLVLCSGRGTQPRLKRK